MIIYMDLILFLNFVIDLIILMVVGIVLKRKKNLTRIILGAFIGSLSVLFLLIKLSNLELTANSKYYIVLTQKEEYGNYHFEIIEDIKLD